MSRFLCVLAATTALAGGAVVTAAVSAQTAPSAPEASSKPQYGTFGFDTAGMDKSVVPGDDIFRYANGT